MTTRKTTLYSLVAAIAGCTGNPAPEPVIDPNPIEEVNSEKISTPTTGINEDWMAQNESAYAIALTSLMPHAVDALTRVKLQYVPDPSGDVEVFGTVSGSYSKKNFGTSATASVDYYPNIMSSQLNTTVTVKQQPYTLLLEARQDGEPSDELVVTVKKDDKLVVVRNYAIPGLEEGNAVTYDYRNRIEIQSPTSGSVFRVVDSEFGPGGEVLYFERDADFYKPCPTSSERVPYPGNQYSSADGTINAGSYACKFSTPLTNAESSLTSLVPALYNTRERAETIRGKAE